MWVLLKLQPYRQISIAYRKSQKLGPRFFGPFQIRRRIGLVAYELILPPTSKIHPVFHVSLLRRFYGDPFSKYIPLPKWGFQNNIEDTLKELSPSGSKEGETKTMYEEGRDKWEKHIPHNSVKEVISTVSNVQNIGGRRLFLPKSNGDPLKPCTLSTPLISDLQKKLEPLDQLHNIKKGPLDICPNLGTSKKLIMPNFSVQGSTDSASPLDLVNKDPLDASQPAMWSAPLQHASQGNFNSRPMQLKDLKDTYKAHVEQDISKVGHLPFLAQSKNLEDKVSFDGQGNVRAQTFNRPKRENIKPFWMKDYLE